MVEMKSQVHNGQRFESIETAVSRLVRESDTVQVDNRQSIPSRITCHGRSPRNHDRRRFQHQRLHNGFSISKNRDCPPQLLSPMTWEEIKRTVEQQGVTDNDEIAWVDLHPYGSDGSDCIEINRDQDGRVEIYDR